MFTSIYLVTSTIINKGNTTTYVMHDVGVKHSDGDTTPTVNHHEVTKKYRAKP